MNCIVDKLINEGVTNFISSGALGFDQLAGKVVASKKEESADIRLVFVLPCKNQDVNWSELEKTCYRNLLDKADEIIYICQEYEKGCMAKRNRYMVSLSSICICALKNKRSGSGQTVRFAGEKGLRVIELNEDTG